MTLPLELGAILDAYVRRAFEQVAQAFPVTTQNIGDRQVTAAKLATGIVLELAVAGTQRKVAFGISNAVWTAAFTSASVTITHGLGTTPAAVAILSAPGGGSNFEAMWRVTSSGATTFACDGTRVSSTTGNGNFYWIAIG